MQILDYIRINNDYEYVVAGKPYDNFNSAWDVALGLWQRNRGELPSDNTNMSDSAILASIAQQINAKRSANAQRHISA